MNTPSEIRPPMSGPSSENSSTPPIERGGLANLFGVIFQPQAAFRAIGAKPRWLLPMAACLMLSLVSVTLMVNRMGIANMMRSALQGNPQAEEIAQKTEESSFARTMIYASPLIQVPIVVAAMAGILLLAFIPAGVEVSFKQAFSIVTHALFAYSVIATSLMLVTVYATKDFTSFDLRNPIATNLGFFLDPAEISKFLSSLASSLDVLSFWFLYLLAVGFAETSPKTRFQKTLPPVLVVWVIYVVGKGALSSFLGR
jgi:hypothetical protein